MYINTSHAFRRILKLPRSTQWKRDRLKVHFIEEACHEEADSQEQQQKYQEEAYDAYSQEQDDVEEADEGFDVDKWHEEMYGPYDDETHQEEWDGDDAYQDQEEEGYDDEAYESYDDGTYEQEGYDNEAWEQEEGYDDEAYAGDEGYADETCEGNWDGDDAYQDQEQEWCGDEAENHAEDARQYGQCIFFASPEGCRRGDMCRYRHDCDPNTGVPLPAPNRSRRRYRRGRRGEPGPEESYSNLPTAGRPQTLHPGIGCFIV